MVYNAAKLNCTWDYMIKKSRRASWTFPYPTFGVRGMTSIALLYWILVLFLEWLPSVLCDIVLCLCRRKQRYHQREFIAKFREPRIYRPTFVDLSVRSPPRGEFSAIVTVSELYYKNVWERSSRLLSFPLLL
jgi:hypothetical protein